jgi:hypothetical protein
MGKSIPSKVDLRVRSGREEAVGVSSRAMRARWGVWIAPSDQRWEIQLEHRAIRDEHADHKDAMELAVVGGEADGWDFIHQEHCRETADMGVRLVTGGGSVIGIFVVVILVITAWAMMVVMRVGGVVVFVLMLMRHGTG